MEFLNAAWNQFEKLATSILAAAALLLSCYEMATRYFWPSQSPDWATEVIIYLIIWAVFLGGSSLIKENRQVRADLITQRLPLPLQRYAEIFNSLVGLFFCSALTYYGYEVVDFAVVMDERSESSLLFPIFWYYLCLPVGMFLMSLRYLDRLYRFCFAYDPVAMSVSNEDFE